MRKLYEAESTDAFLLLDASNAFNRMNRSVALHNIGIICPTISNYLINTYRHPSRLFVSGGSEMLSMEGTTQGDALAMPWYSLNAVSTIQQLRILTPNVQQVWLADDTSASEKISSLHEWYEHLILEGVKNCYYVNGAKSWLIVKLKKNSNL